MHPSDPTKKTDCLLCANNLAGVQLVTRTKLGRIVRVTDTPCYPAFYRFIWQQHVAEFSDLGEEHRQACMQVVYCIDKALREVLNPTKINLASLGNMVPHLHWHAIARFSGDTHFPNPIWSAAPEDESRAEQRNHFQAEILPKITAQLPEVDEKIKSLVHSLKLTNPL